MKNIFYLILIDNGQIICSKKMDKIVLPYIEQDCIFKNVQEAKKFFNDKTKLFIKKNDFNLARIFSEEGLCFFAVVVDVNYRDNLKKINFGTITELKQVPLMLVKEIKWDDSSAIAIENFTRNINYKDAFSIIEAESKFNYYSKESLKTISEFFNEYY